MSFLVSDLAPYLVRVKTSVRPGAAVRSTSTGSRVSGWTCSTWWVIFATGDWAESTLCVTGLVMNRLTRTSTPASSVAENSSRWAVGRGRLEDPPDGGQEAEVGHVVGLVEHGDLDRVELRVTGLDVVLEPAGAGDDDVDAVAQAGDLRAVTDAAEDRHRAQVERVGQRRDRGLDLGGQLPGRRQDQRARAGSAGASACCAASRASTGSTNA